MIKGCLNMVKYIDVIFGPLSAKIITDGWFG